MAVTITGTQLTIEDIEAVARRREDVTLHPDALARIVTCRAFLEKRIEAGEIMYGVNTGIGEFSEVVLNDEQVREFQNSNRKRNPFRAEIRQVVDCEKILGAVGNEDRLIPCSQRGNSFQKVLDRFVG